MILARRGRPRKTVEDFMNLPEGTRAELIDGDIFMSPSPRPRHQRAVIRLLKHLDAHVSAQGLGEVFVAPLDVHLPSGDIVEPDIFFVAKENQGLVQDWVRGVPDLIIEVLSPDRRERDRIVKRGLYAENRVPEFWIVDPEAGSFEVFALRGEQYEPSGYFDKDDALVSPLLPDFKLTVAEVFAQPR
jgi:Uma2 family endonuclease